MGRKKHIIEYSRELALEVSARHASGETLESICRRRNMPGLPQHYHWLDSIPEYAQLLNHARRDYADTCFDRAQDVATKALEETDARLLGKYRLAFDIYSHGASRGNPAKYSPTNNVVQSGQSYSDALLQIAAEFDEDEDVSEHMPNTERTNLVHDRLTHDTDGEPPRKH